MPWLRARRRGLVGRVRCSSQKQANNPGPAQRAGSGVDQGAEKAKESAKEAGKKVGNATKKAGDKIDEKTSD